MSILPLMAGVFLASAILTGLIRRLALRTRVLDLPGSRSAHNNPLPVGGGLSIVISVLAVTSYFFQQGSIPLPEYMAIAAAIFIAVNGLVDDIVELDIKWRLPMQFAAAIWSVAWLGDVPPIQIGGFELSAPWLLNTLAVFGLIWLLNLYNFMDGIDGIAASELVFVNAGAFLIVMNSSDQVITLLSATLVAAGAGFLLWNWSPARVFMGDVGSSFIGFSLGIMAIFSMLHGSMNLWTWLLLLGVFVVDATITLLRRLITGDRWYQGHSCHAYQHAARRYKSHSKVTITVLLVNCLWLGPLAWLATRQPEYGVYITLLGLLPLVYLAFKLEAGKEEIQV
ncbi:MAG: glycosyltransferase family 4 protein [Gammaproteobacteria bacterium]|jgi:Fuc2NAc and GlcNAc transferase|nr:glycosyl transferase [Gammaproteobacteria bacterium]MDP6096331.1 glycosyltransferase family 4 protein [Gammaproteobacteria bacterium]MDP7455101.1 glycosyltransferase family 4 protein [Gammaproteobacteria bacterium]HJO11813.1 glycosyltransferase family 4 protein [Gammaproteobacteria bacterium]